MLTDKELSKIIESWGNEHTKRNITDLCRDVAREQEAAERDRLRAKLLEMHERDKDRHNYWKCAVVDLFGA